VRGFAAISLLGGLGMEDQQNGLMPLDSYALGVTHEKPRCKKGGALPYLCFLFVRGFAAISFLGGLGVEDQQNGLMLVQIVLNVIYFCVFGEGEVYR
jgi:hypothetical protein